MYRIVSDRYRRMIRRVRHFVLHSLLHADDPPHRLALGVAIGMFVTFTPTVGFQMAIVVFLAWLLRGNKAVGLPIVWISNPATIVPIYYSCYKVGCEILRHEMVRRQWWAELGHPPEGWWPAVSFYWSRLIEIALPLWLGGLVVGLAAAYPTYYLVRGLIRAYRLRRWGQLTPPDCDGLLSPDTAVQHGCDDAA